MAGYEGYSKSNNAVCAELCGRYPASVLARNLKVSTAAVKSVLDPCEWHHSSSWYNSVDYYDGALLIPLSHNQMPDPADYYDEEELFEAAETLLALKQEHKDIRKREKTIAGWSDDDCTVEWIEWSGSRRRPRATERSEEHCRVEFNGKATYTITTPSGYTFTKRAGTNGFYITRKNHENAA